MLFLVCHSERSEESIGTVAGAHHDGSFAGLRMTGNYILMENLIWSRSEIYRKHSQFHRFPGVGGIINRIHERDGLAALAAVEGGRAAGLEGVDDILQLTAVTLGADGLGIACAGAERVGAAGADGFILGLRLTEFPFRNPIVLQRHR